MHYFPINQYAKIIAIISTVFYLTACVNIVDHDYAKKMAEEERYKEAINHFTILAKNGHIPSKLALADLYSQEGENQSSEKSLYWYKSIIENDQAYKEKAKYKYARLLANQEDKGANNKKDVTAYLGESYLGGNYSAIVILTKFYSNNNYFSNPKEFGSYLNKLHNKLPTDSSRFSRVMFWGDNGEITKHTKEVDALCRTSEFIEKCYRYLLRDQKYLDSISRDSEILDEFTGLLLKNYAEGNVTTSFVERLGKKLSALDNPQLLYAKRLLVAAAKESPTALYTLLNKSKQYPDILDEEEAKELIEDLKKNDTLDAEFASAVMLYGGNYMASDMDLAYKYFLKNYNLNKKIRVRAISALFLGELYRGGYINGEKFSEALDYWLIAGRLGDPKGYLNISEIFHNGSGIKHNQNISYAFMQIAINNGLNVRERYAKGFDKKNIDYVYVKKIIDDEERIRKNFSTKPNILEN